jgi:hypothetical protein
VKTEKRLVERVSIQANGCSSVMAPRHVEGSMEESIAHPRASMGPGAGTYPGAGARTGPRASALLRMALLYLVAFAFSMTSSSSTDIDLSPSLYPYNSTMLEQPVEWDDNNQRCVPDICNHAHINELKGFQHFIANKYIIDDYWYDANRALECMKNKYITLLGDSTTSEHVLDLICLLSGSSKNEESYNNHCSRLPHLSNETKYIHHRHNDNNEVFMIIDAHGGVRKRANSDEIVPAGLFPAR